MLRLQLVAEHAVVIIKRKRDERWRCHVDYLMHLSTIDEQCRHSANEDFVYSLL